MRDDLAVITCHYNWCGFRRPDQNLNRFLRQMAAFGIPVYGAEASLTDKFITEGNSNWVQIRVREENICFQKEALLNIAETVVPSNYTKIAWMDHDIFFTNLNWREETSIALDTYKLIQPYEFCYWTDSKGNIEKGARSMLSQQPFTEQCLVTPFWTTIPTHHAGFAFAANRELWTTGGKLYPFNFLGGGDVTTLYGAIGPDITTQSLRNSYLTQESNFKPYMAWKKAFGQYINNNTGFIKGSVYHEYHGPRQSRRYGIRDKLVNMFNFNHSISLALNYKRVVEFRNTPYGFLDAVKQYFIERREDDVEDLKIVGIDQN